jgi:ABC-type multidrug transport system fused ATPase/permease subunit
MLIECPIAEMVSSYATNEQASVAPISLRPILTLFLQNMNAVERVLVYTELPEEGDRAKPSDPPSSWPEAGAISFKQVQMAYRPDLPLVLKGVDFEIRPGEKVGIVGRTGAGETRNGAFLVCFTNEILGKSSLMQALFRYAHSVDVTT